MAKPKNLYVQPRGNAGGNEHTWWKGTEGRKKWENRESIINKVYLTKKKRKLERQMSALNFSFQNNNQRQDRRTFYLEYCFTPLFPLTMTHSATLAKEIHTWWLEYYQNASKEHLVFSNQKKLILIRNC